MKKLLILILTLAMVMTSFTACGGNDNTEPAADDQTGQVEQTDDVNTDENADKDADAKDEEKTEDKTEDNNSAKPSDADQNKKPASPSNDKDKESNKKDEPKEEVKPSAPAGSPSKIIDKIYAKKEVSLPVATTELDLSDGEMFTAITGLASSDKVKEAAFSESMMGSQAYSLVVVRVKKSKDAADVADEMLSGINPAKWICVEADDVRVAAYDDLVMLIMVSSQHKDAVTGKEIVSAFKNVCGGTLDVSKKR